MAIGTVGRHAAAWRPLEVALLQQVWLVYVLDRLGVLAHGGGERLESDRSAAELVGDRAEETSIAVVETRVINLEGRERLARDRQRDVAVVPHLGVVADPLEPAVRDARRA